MALRYLLDTNVLSEPMRPVPNTGVLARIADIGTSAAVGAPAWHELQFGKARLPAGRRRRAIELFLDRLERVIVVLPYDKSAAAWHARERARLERKGKTPPFTDGQLAAIAAVNDLVLVTRNVRDFSGFAGVRVESWFTTS
ncbi:MAG: type II toxin-antitoxin system VapC family toxin [Deltaproteobacteria bacterium]|nr:type II toxin-antitoxin system VapC family toxin [Deltaproteobacteria bacterium]